MKKLFLTIGLAAITAIGWGQYTFLDKNPNTSPSIYLKQGSSDLLIASNYQITGVVLTIASGVSYGIGVRNAIRYASIPASSSNPNLYRDGYGAKYLGFACGLMATGFFVAGYAKNREGIEKIYWGANGITIPLK